MLLCLIINTITQLNSLFVSYYWSSYSKCLINLLMKWVQFINKCQGSSLREPIKKQFVLQFCFFYLLSRYTNIMTDKGFNLFDKCALRCVHLSSQEEECTSSSWEHSKIYTSGSIINSQRMLTEINEKSATAKVSIWVESYTVKHLKTFRIFSSQIKISLIILSW